MKHLIPYILLVSLVLIAGLFAGQKAKEGFQSAGTLVQLETSHVPTRAEVRDQQRWLRQRVRQDLWDLTGSP
jgi:hypothetical protein